MYFKDIKGKEREKEMLIRAVLEDKVPHAQLFLGRTGSGQLPLALAFASYVLCSDRQPTDSCGVCSSCIKSHKYMHADMHFAFPVVKYGSLERKRTTSANWLGEWRQALHDHPYMDIREWQTTMGSENSQPDINKEECVQIVKKLGMKAFEATDKVLIIWMPEYLRKEGNRLLKIIEEPRPDTLMIMVADNQEEILGTIISRTQITKVQPFTTDEISAYLVENLSVNEDKARQVAAMSDGNLGSAISLIEGAHPDYSEALFHWLRVSYKMEPVELRKWVDEMAKWGRQGQKNFVKYGLHFFREYLYMIHTKQLSNKLSPEEIETASKMKKILDVEKVEAIIKLLDKSHNSIVRNANAKITFMADSLHIAYIMRGMEVNTGLYEV